MEYTPDTPSLVRIANGLEAEWETSPRYDERYSDVDDEIRFGLRDGLFPYQTDMRTRQAEDLARRLLAAAACEHDHIVSLNRSLSAELEFAVYCNARDATYGAFDVLSRLPSYPPSVNTMAYIWGSLPKPVCPAHYLTNAAAKHKVGQTQSHPWEDLRSVAQIDSCTLRLAFAVHYGRRLASERFASKIKRWLDYLSISLDALHTLVISDIVAPHVKHVAFAFLW